MGILTRISNIFRAKVNDALDEAENPIELLNQKIRDMEESLNGAKLSSAQILGNVHEIEKKMNDAKKTSEEFDEKVKLALSKGNEELAKKALAKKLEADKSYDSLKASYEDASNKAEASKKVNEILANVDAGSNKISLDDIERKIQKKEAFAEGLNDLREDNSLDKEFEKLKEIDLEEELKKYR